MITVFKASSIIEKEAILNELAQNDIAAFSGERSISRKMANTTVDLAFDGVSVLFDGFAIQVEEKDREAAEKIIKGFLARSEISVVSPAEPGSSRHLRKFYYCAMFSLTIPALFNFYGLYQLYLGLRNGEPIRWPFFMFSLLVMAGSSVLWIFMGWSYLFNQ